MSAHRVLVIEDEDGARDALTSLLRDEGYLVHASGSGRAGLREADAFEPDTVVCDFYLPDTTGLQVVRELRRIRPQATLIVLTAGCGGADIERTLRREADFFLRKPLDVARFQRLLRRKPEAAMMQPTPIA